MNKIAYKKILDDVCGEYCPSTKYCILKEFLIESHPSPRLLIQLKLIDKFKYEISELETRDIGWAEAISLWIESGNAKRFGELYSENKKIKQLYKEITTI